MYFSICGATGLLFTPRMAFRSMHHNNHTTIPVRQFLDCALTTLWPAPNQATSCIRQAPATRLLPVLWEATCLRNLSGTRFYMFRSETSISIGTFHCYHHQPSSCFHRNPTNLRCEQSSSNGGVETKYRINYQCLIWRRLLHPTDILLYPT